MTLSIICSVKIKLGWSGYFNHTFSLGETDFSNSANMLKNGKKLICPTESFLTFDKWTQTHIGPQEMAISSQNSCNLEKELFIIVQKYQKINRKAVSPKEHKETMHMKISLWKTNVDEISTNNKKAMISPTY